MWQNSSEVWWTGSSFDLYIMAAEKKCVPTAQTNKKNQNPKPILCSGYVFHLMLHLVAMAMIALIL